MFDTFINFVLAAVAFGMLILVHELGHFLAAKAVGVRVETFSIGFWKKIAWFRRGDTEYRLSLIPLGGYVKLAGEIEGEGTGAPDEFCSKSPGARALVFVSGVAMNVIFALLAFIAAFTIGVPFEVAEVGGVEKGAPAWEAGLLPGDRIRKIDGTANPDFQDVQRTVALMGRDSVSVVADRDGAELHLEIFPIYDRAAGMRRIGFVPPVEPVVTGFFGMEALQGRSPAREAGMEPGDRIVSVGGKSVEFFRDIQQALEGHSGPVEVVLLRNDETLAVTVEPFVQPRYVLGISGVNTTIESLQGDGPAQRAGFRAGDRIKAVAGTPVRSAAEMDDIIEDEFGSVTFTVQRAADGTVDELEIEIMGPGELDEFMFSFVTGRSNELTWVRPDGPAWRAGLRGGDVLTHIGDVEVKDWGDVLQANARKGAEPRVVRWMRDGEVFEAEVTPEKSMEGQPAVLGAVFNAVKTHVRREGIAGAVLTGARKTWGALADIVFTVRGFATRQVSTQHVGGIVLIAYVSYQAAAGGVGQLLYFFAIISSALAFLNILPVPVLDGGHLMFLGIEKLRGRPVSERVRAASQAVGLALLLLLVVYAIRNDILRFLN